jgi:hypothetical protein
MICVIQEAPVVSQQPDLMSLFTPRTAEAAAAAPAAAGHSLICPF